MMFIINEMFFRYDATEAVSYSSFTGSIHVGIDTVAGDYYLQNASQSTGDLKYGVRSSEDQPFTIIPFTDNQIIRVKNGEHLIIYESNLLPVQTVEEITRANAKATAETKSSEAGETATTDFADLTEGMIKLSNESYNTPFVLDPQSDQAYYELYDKEVNVISHELVSSESLLSISPEQASYIKFSDTKISPLTSYTTTGQMKGTYFTPAVYVVGTNLESRAFELEPIDATCRYRILDSSVMATTTPFNDCSNLPILLDLVDGQIIEIHGANLVKYDGDLDYTSDTTEQ